MESQSLPHQLKTIMNRWHIQTIWLYLTITALILSILINCKRARNTKVSKKGIPKHSESYVYGDLFLKEKVKKRKLRFRAEDSDVTIENRTITKGITRKYCVDIANTLRGNFAIFLIHQNVHEELLWTSTYND